MEFAVLYEKVETPKCAKSEWYILLLSQYQRKENKCPLRCTIKTSQFTDSINTILIIDAHICAWNGLPLYILQCDGTYEGHRFYDFKIEEYYLFVGEVNDNRLIILCRMIWQHINIYCQNRWDIATGISIIGTIVVFK